MTYWYYRKDIVHFAERQLKIFDDWLARKLDKHLFKFVNIVYSFLR
jgi:hypothetical protein